MSHVADKKGFNVAQRMQHRSKVRSGGPKILKTSKAFDSRPLQGPDARHKLCHPELVVPVSVEMLVSLSPSQLQAS